MTASSRLAISNDQLAMHYQLSISNVAARNCKSSIANASLMANRKSLIGQSGALR